ncbi:hypothetical protein [Marisediminicola antarctica]|uniref:Uncharacterized protein n=1 Tax=Marisediminicola antarctica TaxID=674079 RepID=A0A7L5AMP4_9MICO|nr:hypothetical protein [Marisediminicola antarctica]QHO69559.1 hypothetical protein BHD05_07805 [Marisediminicola antarctica]
MNTPDLLISDPAGRVNAENQRSQDLTQTLIDTVRVAVHALGDTAGVSVHDDSPAGELYVEFAGQNFLIRVETM